MSLPAYLLSLADLHAAAPGVLDVVFGPDGDFEGAPKWRPMLSGSLKGAPGYYPLWHLGARGPVALHRDAYGYATSIDDAALDLRIPTVAERLAGLCARALGEFGAGWRVQRTGTWDLTDGVVSCCWRSDGTPWADMPQWPAVAGGPWRSDVEFLRALTLALAPRIAALRTTASPR